MEDEVRNKDQEEDKDLSMNEDQEDDENASDEDQEDDENASDEDQEDDENASDEDQEKLEQVNIVFKLGLVFGMMIVQFLNWFPKHFHNPGQVQRDAEHPNNAAQVLLNNVKTPQHINYCATQESINDACIKISKLVERKILENPGAKVLIGFRTNEVERVENYEQINKVGLAEQREARIMKVELIALCVAEASGETCYLLHFTCRDIELPSAFIEIIESKQVIFVGWKNVVSQFKKMCIDFHIKKDFEHLAVPCQKHLGKENRKKSLPNIVAHHLHENFKYNGRDPAQLLYKDLSKERTKGQIGERISQDAQDYAATVVWLYLKIYNIPPQKSIARGEGN